MTIGELIHKTGQLHEDMSRIVPLRCTEESVRGKASAAACALSLEHWEACRSLIEKEFITSAVALHRCQFEAVVRAAWIWYAATEGEIIRLTGPLSESGMQAAKNLAGLQEMIADIGKKAPAPVYSQLSRFRDEALKPVNSFVHAGLHAIRRTVTGYPEQLVLQIYKNINSVAALSWFQIETIEGRSQIDAKIRSVLKIHEGCFNLLEKTSP